MLRDGNETVRILLECFNSFKSSLITVLSTLEKKAFLTRKKNLMKEENC